MKLAKYAGIIGTTAAALGWYASRVETRWLRIHRPTWPITHWPEAFDGYRIAHLSDLHLNAPLMDEFLPRVIQAVNRERPDIVVITGDFLSRRDGGQADWPGILGQLQAPDGVWAVLGNHDMHVGADAVSPILRAAGITLLRNQHHVIRRGTDQFVLAGLDDVLHGKPDLNQTLDGIPANSPVILLVHEPDFAKIAAIDPRIVLQLSGHTHGGQVRLPGVRPLMLPLFGHIFPAGEYEVNNLMLYVTQGVGGSGHPVLRFNCRPEITSITLTRNQLPPHITITRTKIKNLFRRL